MKVCVVVLALSVLLTAAPSYAQAPAAPAAAPQTQKPAAPQPAPAQPPAPTPRFQDGLKYAYVQLELVAAYSNQGKAFNGKVQALQEQKVKELQDRNKALQSAQEKLDKGASVMNDTARAQLQADIEKQQRDLQRATEDAQQEVQSLTQQAQAEFFRLAQAAIDRVAKAKQLHFVFLAGEGGLIWADPATDLTAEVIKEIDAGAASAAAKPAAPAPAAPAQVPAKP
jgi:outer membrane protein